MASEKEDKELESVIAAAPLVSASDKDGQKEESIEDISKLILLYRRNLHLI